MCQALASDKLAVVYILVASDKHHPCTIAVDN